MGKTSGSILLSMFFSSRLAAPVRCLRDPMCSPMRFVIPGSSQMSSWSHVLSDASRGYQPSSSRNCSEGPGLNVPQGWVLSCCWPSVRSRLPGNWLRGIALNCKRGLMRSGIATCNSISKSCAVPNVYQSVRVSFVDDLGTHSWRFVTDLRYCSDWTCRWLEGTFWPVSRKNCISIIFNPAEIHKTNRSMGTPLYFYRKWASCEIGCKPLQAL